jgi:ABC-2 type transport system permease protein
VSRPASPVRATVAQAVMELRLTARRGENILVALVVPAAVLVFFGSVDVVRVPTGRPVDVLLPGSLALAVIATSFVSLGIATAYERQNGVLKRLGGSPLTRASLVAAKIGVALLIECVQVVVLIAIGWQVLGWTPGPQTNPSLVVAVTVIGSIAFAGLGLLLAGSLRAELTLALANALFLVVLLLGGVIVPIDQLPGPLAAIAEVLPGAALSEAFGIALGAGGDAVGPMAILVAWGLAAVVLTVRTFRWE